MAGKRQPTDLVIAKGRKHLSKAEEAERRGQEVWLPSPETVVPPKWLPKRHHREFWEIGEILRTAGLYTELDRDVLGQYFVARDQWQRADKEAAKAIRDKDEKLAREWASIQNTYFKQARQCGEAMGLSVTSRCRLVVPPSMDQPMEDDNPFLQLIQGGAARNA